MIVVLFVVLYGCIKFNSYLEKKEIEYRNEERAKKEQIVAEKRRIEQEKRRIEQEKRDTFLALIEVHYQKLIELYKSGNDEYAINLLDEFDNFKKLDYKDVKDIYRKIKIRELENRVIKIPASNIDENLLIYQKLLAMNPGNNKYKQKVDYYSRKQKAERDKIHQEDQKNIRENIYAANRVMSLANEDCRIFEEGPHLVVEMKIFIPDPTDRFRYISAIADADMILNGKPRNIYFYDPSGKKIAQADTLRGIRLID